MGRVWRSECRYTSKERQETRHLRFETGDPGLGIQDRRHETGEERPLLVGRGVRRPGSVDTKMRPASCLVSQSSSDGGLSARRDLLSSRLTTTTAITIGTTKRSASSHPYWWARIGWRGTRVLRCWRRDVTGSRTSLVRRNRATLHCSMNMRIFAARSRVPYVTSCRHLRFVRLRRR